MNDDILKLAKEVRLNYFEEDEETAMAIEAFYRAAYNKAIEDAAVKCDYLYDYAVAEVIRALEME